MTTPEHAENELDAVDREALSRAVKIALRSREPGRREQIESMLRENWLDGAEFCSCHLQIESLQLKPWEIGLAPYFGGDGNSLLDRMLRAGVSQYEPRPLHALERVERKRKRAALAKVEKAKRK